MRSWANSFPSAGEIAKMQCWIRDLSSVRLKLWKVCTATYCCTPISYSNIWLEILKFSFRDMCGTSKATIFIILLRNYKCIVKRNSQNKPKGAFPKREESIFSSATGLISMILASRTYFYTDYWASFKLQTMYLVNINVSLWLMWRNRPRDYIDYLSYSHFRYYLRIVPLTTIFSYSFLLASIYPRLISFSFLISSVTV